MPIELPTEIVEASTASPQLLIIFSAPKAGKTTVAAELPRNLIADLEKGSDFVSAYKVQITTYIELLELFKKLKEAGKPYRYLTIDTATALEDMVLPLALVLYQKTPMGKTYTGDILALPNGAGYKYLRDAYQLMVEKARDAAERVILLGHTKDKNIEKNGKEVMARELALTGRLSSIVCASADAIGFLYREGNQGIITFETSSDLICGARPRHLRNTSFVLSEEIDGKLRTYWDRIFID